MYRIFKYTGSIVPFLCVLFFAENTSGKDLKPSNEILINQLGYQPAGRKYFKVAGQFSSFQIINQEQEVVFEGKLSGPKHDQYAGEDVWEGDFSNLQTPGIYIIKLPGDLCSWKFEISDDIYEKLLTMVTHGLYASRCGYEVKDKAYTHPPCHLNQGDTMYVDGKKIFVGMEGNGGWHDGGDYWRSSMSAAQTVSRMLWPLEMFPGKLDLTPSLLFPEEKWDGNTDVLSEIKWGLDWLFKLQFDDGGIATGISPILFSMPPMGTPPQDDPVRHYIGAANSSYTAKAGAVFTKAARVLRRYDADYAEKCQQKALRCWEYLQKHKEMVDPATIKVYGRHSDEEDRLWFAVEMYKTTGDIQYHEEFVARYKKLGNPYPKAPVSTQTIRSFNLHEALISYCFIKRGANKKIQSEILEQLIKASDELVSISKNEGYGCVLNEENWKERHTIGNALQMAWELAMAYELTGIKEYRAVAEEQIQIILGINPLGKVFITEVGSNPIKNPHYRPFGINNQAPVGLTVKGPTHDKVFIEKILNNNAPSPFKSYVDEVRAHWCNEPDIEVQGHLIGLAAYFHTKR